MKTIIITIAIGFIMLLYGFTTYKPPEAQTVKSEDSATAITGAALFQKNCAVCHGIDLNGNPPAFPSLKEVKTRMTKVQIANLLKTGRNNMPSFSYLSDAERNMLVGFLYGENTESHVQTQLTPEEQGRNLFVANCSLCHKAKPGDPQPPGQRRMGMRPPVLAGVTRYLDIPRFEAVLNMGHCYMPSFAFLSHQEKSSLYTWLKTLEKSVPQYNGMMRMRRNRGCGGFR
jgi:mono/diheme cytochrome c family protein